MKKIIILSIVSITSISHISHGMMRRLTTQIAISPLQKMASLTMQKRSLLPGQEHNPAWIRANQDVTDLQSALGLETLTPMEIENILDNQEASVAYDLRQNPLLSHCSMPEKEILLLKEEIETVLNKHNIDPKTINIRFVGQRKPEAGYSIAGRSIFVYPQAFAYSKATRTASTEHEIGHIITHDVAYIKNMLSKNHFSKEILKADLLLREKRADIHSFIQSKQNIETIGQQDQSFIGYASTLKIEELRLIISSIAPSLSHEIFKDPIVYETLFEHAKKIANQAYNEKKITAQTLHKIINACDKPTYLEHATNSNATNSEISHGLAKYFITPILYLKKNVFGIKPWSNTIWNSIEQQTEYLINRNNYMYTIIDDDTHWKIIFTK